jgi:hypothetical protein
MPTNLDILAASDFERNPFKQTIVRRIRGDHTHFEDVEAVVEIDNQAAGANTSEGGLDQRSDKLQVTAGGLLEVAVDQEVASDDQWEIGEDVWKAIGDPIGSDAGSKTYVIKKLRRIRGRMPNVNTQV